MPHEPESFINADRRRIRWIHVQYDRANPQPKQFIQDGAGCLNSQSEAPAVSSGVHVPHGPHILTLYNEVRTRNRDQMASFPDAVENTFIQHGRIEEIRSFSGGVSVRIELF